MKVGTDNACRAPEVASMKCAQNSECKTPLVCGRDLTCRQECVEDVDCPGGGKPDGQKCTESHTCADPKLDTNYDPITNDFKPPTTGTAGTTGVAGSGGAGTTGASGSDGGADAAAGTGAAGTGTDAAAGTTGAAGTDGGAGTGAAGTGTDGGNPEVAVTPDGIEVKPNASLRQGQGAGITITITKASGGLSNASVVDFGSARAMVVADMSTDTSLVLRVTVPHGAALGKQTLKVSTKGGQITATDVVTVTAITAGPAGADTNAGSEGAPFKSLKQALAVSDVGDTVHLLDGKYTIAASGESWGYPLPDDITIVGDSPENTVIDGVGAANSPDGFDVSKKLTLKTLTVQHFRYGIDITKADCTVTLQDVVVGGNSSHGIYIEQAGSGATVNILGAKSMIDQPGLTGLYVYYAPNTTVNITDATLKAGSHVIQYSGNVSGAKLNITGATITQLAANYYSALIMQPSGHTMGTTVAIMNSTIVGNISDNDSKGSLTITGGTITQKYGNGIDFDGGTLTMTGTKLSMVTTGNTGLQLGGMGSVVSLKSVTIDGGNYNIQQSGGGSSVKLRSTTLKNASSYGAYYLQAGDLDMGTMTEFGGNTVLAPSYTYGYAIYIARGQGAAAGNPVTCSGTSVGVDGNIPAAQTVDASGGAIDRATQLWHVNVGNKLIFYAVE